MQHQTLLAAIVESSDDAILTKSLDGIILSWNAGAERIFEYSAAEIIGQSVETLIPLERRSEEQGIIRQLRLGHRIDHFETIRLSKSARRIDVSISISPIRDSSGTIVAASKVCRDITAQKELQSKTKQSDAVSRALLDAMSEGVAFLDATGAVIWTNASLKGVLGRTLPELLDPNLEPRFKIQRTDGSLFPLEEQPALTVLKTNQGVRDVEMGVPDLYGDGLKWVSVNAEPVHDAEGKIQGVVVSIFDVTERRKSRQFLHESKAILEEQVRARTRALTQAQRLARMGSWDWDLKTDVTVWSEEMYRILGYDPQKPIPPLQERFRKYLPPTADHLKTAVEKAVEDGSAFDIDLHLAMADGSIRIVRAQGEGSRDATGKIIKVHGTIQDVTEKRQQEEILRKTVDRLSLATQTTHIGIWDCDLTTNRLTWDQTMFRLYGASPDQFSHDYQAWTSRIHPDDLVATEKELDRAIRGEKEFNTEFRVVWPDGSIHHIKAVSTVQRDSSAKAIGLLGINFDITDLKRTEEALRSAKDQAELSNRELQAFSYSVSHDLRAPLRGIDGWSQALVEDFGDQLDGRAREYLGRVRSEAQRMGELIDDMLKLSRTTKMTMRPVPVDLSVIAQRIDDRLRETSPDRIVEFTVQPDLRTVGDPGLLDAALTNLIENAWKFTSRQPVARIELGRTLEDGKATYFINDNGAGFDMAYADKLFAPFQRLHKMTDYPGTGIGLATVQRIISRHGGKVWAQAAPGRGATFYFTLEKQT